MAKKQNETDDIFESSSSSKTDGVVPQKQAEPIKSSMPPAETSKPSIPATMDEPIEGLEGVETDMLIIPRVKLVQKTSIETDIEGISAGFLVNSVTKEKIGNIINDPDSAIKTTVKIIPIVNGKSRLYFKEIEQGGGLLCRSNDGKFGIGEPGGVCANCPMIEWGNNKEAPSCTELINVYVMVEGYDYPMPLVLSFGRSSMSAGRQFINYFFMDSKRNKKNPWYFKYELRTKKISNEKGVFFVYDIRPGGLATDEESARGREYYNLMKSVSTTIHEDEEEIKKEQEKVHDTQGDANYNDDAGF